MSSKQQSLLTKYYTLDIFYIANEKDRGADILPNFPTPLCIPYAYTMQHSQEPIMLFACNRRHEKQNKPFETSAIKDKAGDHTKRK